MADIIKVNTGKLSSDAQQVRRCAEQIRQKMELLTSYERQLDGMWDGIGSEAFKASFYEDLSLLTELAEKVERIYTFEENAKTQYETCEKKVEGIISALK